MRGKNEAPSVDILPFAGCPRLSDRQITPEHKLGTGTLQLEVPCENTFGSATFEPFEFVERARPIRP